MYKREEAGRIREEFWTAFGKYMRPVPSAAGDTINWLNYRTTIKDVYFRMDVGQKSAMIAIALEHNAPEVRDLYFHQFRALQKVLHNELQEEWMWQQNVRMDNGKIVSRIGKELQGVSLFNREQWPELISFFKPRIIALDSFWENAKFTFESL